ncbi:MAG: glycosyltransferase family 4 protein [Phycisphaerae bacterium]|nr:glycosyltransferase family 4 protein [Phycisphaerae bacterium]
MKDRALRFLPSVSIDVIPNGVEIDRFYPAQSGAIAAKLRLLTVGRLSATKRVEMLIDAVEILHTDGVNLHLTIAGGGQLEPQLKETISGRNLGEIIEIAGRIDPENMPQVYRESDIFVSATVQEGMSNAMLEAMASGLAIITTRCEGVEELITDNGVIVECANAEEIARAIRSLADNPLAVREMAVAARSRAEQFTWSRSAQEYLALYERLK